MSVIIKYVELVGLYKALVMEVMVECLKFYEQSITIVIVYLTKRLRIWLFGDKEIWYTL